MMTDQTSYWPHFVQVLRSPQLAIVGVADAMLCWWSTRRWNRLFGSLVVVLASIVATSFAVLARLQYRDIFSVPFVVRMEQELPISELLAVDFESHRLRLETRQTQSDRFELPLRSEAERLANARRLAKWTEPGALKAAIFHANAALRMAPTDQRLRVRLALLQDLNHEDLAAEAAMRSLSKWNTTGIETAHAWLAWSMVEGISKPEELDIKRHWEHLHSCADHEQIDGVSWLTWAMFYQELGLHSQAEELFQRAASKELRSQFMVLQEWEKQNRLDLSRELGRSMVDALQTVATRDPLTNEQEYMLARALHASGKDGEAIGVYRTLVTKNGDYSQASRQRLVSLLLAQQRLVWKDSSRERTLQWMDEAASLAPMDPEVGELIAEGVVKEPNLPDSAKESLKVLIASKRATSRTQAWLAEAFNQRGQFESAVVRAMAALEKDPNCAMALRELGRAQLSLNRIEAAAAALGKAKDLAAQDPAVWEWYGQALIALGDEEEGAAAWEKSLALLATQSTLRRKLVDLYRSHGDEQKAALHFAYLGQSTAP